MTVNRTSLTPLWHRAKIVWPAPFKLSSTIAFFALVLGALLCPPLMHSQPANTGTITGRVLNPATGKYVENAEIRTIGGDVATSSDSEGYYRLSPVPVGTATLSVLFAGYRTTTATVEVTAGAVVNKDFSIISTDAGSDDTVKLGTFVVSSEREGNAKAIMAQRNSMNITVSVSSDVFGTTSEGNVGEFLKYLPGVDLEYVEADTRTPRLGGLDPSYTGVTLNGLGMASADAFQQANGTDNVRPGSGNRSFGFEQVSINSIESIEVNLTTAADQDASSPAGTINLKTKKGFDRKERFIGYSVIGTANSEDPTLRRTYGPGDSRTFKIKGGGTVDYYDAFFNHRLGVALNISESNIFNQQRLVQLGYSTAPTATDPRPYVVNSITLKSGPKFTERFSSSLGLDFKASKYLTFSFVSGYQWYSAQYFNRQIAVSAARANITGDGLTHFDYNNDGATVAYGGAQASKLTRSYQLVPSFEYRRNNLEVAGAVNFATSTNSYGAISRRQNTRDVPVNSLTGTDFRISRSAATDVDFTFAQISGLTPASTSAAKDASNFANFTNPRVVDDGRYNKKNIYQGQLDAKYTAVWKLPVTFKLGGKITESTNANDDRTPMYTWNYVGPGGGSTGSWAGLPSPTVFDMGTPVVNFVNLAGNVYSPTFANRQAIASLFYAHPEYFVNGSNPLNYYQANMANHKRIREQVNATYFMASTRYKRFSMQAGLRLEQTIVTSVQFDPLSLDQVTAAGFTTSQQTAVAAVGSPGQPGYQPAVVVTLPTTLAGIDYQYKSRPLISASSDYHNFFPSASAKYEITPNLQVQVGFSHTIRRPDYNKIGGTVSIDDVNNVLTVPVQSLEPEQSDNYTARIAYYFNPVGSFTITGTENRLKHASITVDTPSENTSFGDAFPGFDVRTYGNAVGIKTVKSLTLGYNQTLKLPSIFRSTSVFANFTRLVQDDALKFGNAPFTVAGGVSVKYLKFKVGLNAKWTDDTPWNFTEGRYRKHRVMEDLNLGYDVMKNLSLFVSGRNITNEPDYIYENRNVQYIQKYEHYGSIWTFGVSGKF